jgi:mono/diheme cytochrome c family protein
LLKTLWKNSSGYRTVTLQLECFSGLHHSRATAHSLHTIERVDRPKPWDYTVATVAHHRTSPPPKVFSVLHVALAIPLIAYAGSLVSAASMQEPKPIPTNAVEADAASLAAGKKLFASNCASCHGETAQGDGKAGATLNPKPPSLVDATWIHGSSDGEIFGVIRDGVKDTGMKAFGSRMTAHQMWDVVNYLRSIASDTPSTPR